MTHGGIAAVATPLASPHPWVAAGDGAVRFGIAYGPRADWVEVRDFVQVVEALGFDSYWTMDHPVSGFDAWSSLAALAAVTTSIRLGPLVSCVFYRSPAMLARLAADVDRVSGGRLVLGLGGGNHAREFATLGLPFPGTTERLAAVAETVHIVRGLWGEESFTVAGEQHQGNTRLVRPGPVQQPRVPILIAGGGEKVTLRQVAALADASNFSPHAMAGSAYGAEDVQRKLAALRDHCDALGRSYAAILRTQVAVPVVLAETPSMLAAKLAAIPATVRRGYASSTLAGLPEDAVTYYHGLVGAGLNYFIAGIYGNDIETVRLLAERVVPTLRDKADIVSIAG
jgi:alkanesulfonate monooxygenase SsuD/methylene tetrahydromethanopterin reductase-like flavin-dependent oxidoreductase (luciferase family)